MKKRGRDRNTKISVSSDTIKRLKEDNSFKILKSAFEDIQDRYKLSFDELKALLEEKPERLTLPVSIFYNRRLSAFEIICKYLKENLNFKLSKIASLLNRNQRTVWVTYHNSIKKQKSRLTVKKSVIEIPVEIFSDRKFSVLENLVSYLKDNYNLSFAQISSLLQKDPRNIWTVYSRFEKKKR